MNAFDTLKIPITKDKREIKRAYAKLVKEYHPEEHPEEFKLLHDAYEMAMEYAKYSTEEEMTIGEDEIEEEDSGEESIEEEESQEETGQENEFLSEYQTYFEEMQNENLHDTKIEQEASNKPEYEEVYKSWEEAKESNSVVNELCEKLHKAYMEYGEDGFKKACERILRQDEYHELIRSLEKQAIVYDQIRAWPEFTVRIYSIVHNVIDGILAEEREERLIEQVRMDEARRAEREKKEHPIKWKRSHRKNYYSKKPELIKRKSQDDPTWAIKLIIGILVAFFLLTIKYGGKPQKTSMMPSMRPYEELVKNPFPIHTLSPELRSGTTAEKEYKSRMDTLLDQIKDSFDQYKVMDEYSNLDMAEQIKSSRTRVDNTINWNKQITDMASDKEMESYADSYGIKKESLRAELTKEDYLSATVKQAKLYTDACEKMDECLNKLLVARYKSGDDSKEAKKLKEEYNNQLKLFNN